MRAVVTTFAIWVLVTVVAVPAAADMRPLSFEQVRDSVDMGGLPTWDQVAAEIHAAMDARGLVDVERIFATDAMKTMVPEADRAKLMAFVPRHRIEATIVLMALASWQHGKLDTVLERDPASWWRPGDGKGYCACEVVLDETLCTMGSTCAWHGGRCGCS